MERGSSKHGPRLDDELEQEVRAQLQGSPSGSRSEETMQPEPAADREPNPSTVPTPDAVPVRDTALEMTGEDIEGRSRLGRYLSRTVFPADKDALLSAAHESNAPDDVLAQIERLPAGERFDTVARVWAALGHPMDRRF